jgi:CRP/FNR family transcriptional regulator, anaerobic regulatory protein
MSRSGVAEQYTRPRDERSAWPADQVRELTPEPEITAKEPGTSVVNIASPPLSPCDVCRLRDWNFCGGLFNKAALPWAVTTKHRTTPARQNIYRAGEINDGVLLVCEGWAVRFIQLPNGKRQILSLVMPGDLISPASMLERRFPFSIQAVTKVRSCTISFHDVLAGIRQSPLLFDAWVRLAAAEHRQADRRLVDLGQRNAVERVAALLYDILLRYEERGELRDDNAFPFPMSQQQIAEFTGLTPVHVCRVVAKLRKNGICQVGHGTAKVCDRAELERLASLR